MFGLRRISEKFQIHKRINLAIIISLKTIEIVCTFVLLLKKQENLWISI